MFFIGLFASPLPYLMLTVIYLSGYAWCCFRQQDAAASPGQEGGKVVQIASENQNDHSGEDTFFWLEDEQLQADHPAPVPSNAGPPLIISPFLLLFCPQATPARHRVRPPPEACRS